MKEVHPEDLEVDELVPGLGWSVSTETIKQIDEIDGFRRRGIACALRHPECFLLD